MPRFNPREPIFKKDIKKGAVAVGNTPPSTPLLTAVRISSNEYAEIYTPQPLAYCNGALFSASITGDDEIWSWSLGAPSTPTLEDTLASTAHQQRAIAADEARDLIYVLGDQALLVVDVSDPAAMSIVGSITGEADLDLAGDFGYSLAYNSAAQEVYFTSDDTVGVVDVSSPASPTMGSTAALGGARALGAKGSVLIEGDNSTIRAIAASTLAATDTITDATAMPFVLNLAVDLVADIAYVASWGSSFGSPVTLTAIDISNVGALSVLGSVQYLASNNASLGFPVVADGGYVYVFGGDYDDIKMYRINVSNPASMTVENTVALPSARIVDSAVIVGGHIYYVDGGDPV